MLTNPNEFAIPMEPLNRSALQISIQETLEANLKATTQEAYDNHINGTFGIITFLEEYNRLHKKSIAILPERQEQIANSGIYHLDSSVLPLLEVMRFYFEIKFVLGYSNDCPIKVSHKNLPLSESTMWTVYSAIKWFYDNNGFYKCNPFDHPVFMKYFIGLKNKKRRETIASGTKSSRAITYEDIGKIINFDWDASGSFKTRLGVMWLKALITVNFYCFFRCNETFSFTMDCCRFEIHLASQRPAMVLKLNDRKYNADGRPQEFWIFATPLEPFTNAYYYLGNF
jgi:hypothetical protein